MARNRKKSYKDLICKITLLAEFSAELGVPVQLGNVEFNSTSTAIQESIINKLMPLFRLVEAKLVADLQANSNHYKQKRFIKWQECYITVQNYKRDYFNSM